MMSSRYFLLPAFLITATLAFGQAPSLINYQGRLVDGTNLVSGTIDIVFRVYNSPTSNIPLYVESQQVVVVNGLYSTVIGEAPALGSIDEVARLDNAYLELEINNTPLTPRERFTPPPFAKRSREIWRFAGSGISPGQPPWQALWGVKYLNHFNFAVSFGNDTWPTHEELFVFPPPTESVVVTRGAFKIFERSWEVCNTNKPKLELQVWDQNGNLLRTLSDSDVDLKTAATNQWVYISLDQAVDKTITPDEFVTFYLHSNGEEMQRVNEDSDCTFSLDFTVELMVK